MAARLALCRAEQRPADTARSADAGDHAETELFEFRPALPAGRARLSGADAATVRARPFALGGRARARPPVRSCDGPCHSVWRGGDLLCNADRPPRPGARCARLRGVAVGAGAVGASVGTIAVAAHAPGPRRG